MPVFGWSMTGIGLAGGIVGISDRYMIAWLLGCPKAGPYVDRYDLLQRALNMLMLSSFMAFSPLVFNYFDRAQHAEVDHVLNKQSALLLVTSVPVAALLAFNAPLFAEIFSGAAFRLSPIMLILWIAAATSIQGWVAYYICYACPLTDNLLRNAVVVAACAILNVLLSLLLIPVLGILGAALATLGTYAILFLSPLIIVRQWFVLSWPVRDALKLLALLAFFGPLFVTIHDARPPGLAMAYGAAIASALAAAMLLMNFGQCRRVFVPPERRRLGHSL